jgi:hypothetical protein
MGVIMLTCRSVSFKINPEKKYMLSKRANCLRGQDAKPLVLKGWQGYRSSTILPLSRNHIHTVAEESYALR